MIMGQCIYLREGVKLKVSKHIPWQARDHHDSLERRAKCLREEGFRTKIQQKNSDYILLKRGKVDPLAKWVESWDREGLPCFQSVSSRGLNNKLTPSKDRGRQGMSEVSGGLEMRRPVVTNSTKLTISPDKDRAVEPRKKSRGGVLGEGEELDDKDELEMTAVMYETDATPEDDLEEEVLEEQVFISSTDQEEWENLSGRSMPEVVTEGRDNRRLSTVSINSVLLTRFQEGRVTHSGVVKKTCL